MPCAICGKDSKQYKLCLDHNRKFKAGEIKKCAECGTWKDDNKPLCYSCYSAKQKNPEKRKASLRAPRKSDNVSLVKGAAQLPSEGLKAVFAPDEAKTFCAICGEESRGKPLCYGCYQKSKSGEVTKCETCDSWKNNKLPKCKECWSAAEASKGKSGESALDFRERYPDEPRYRCRNGIMVRSKIEKEIADWLYINGIRFAYEPLLFFNNVELHPDFYLEDIKLVLEHWGMDSKSYNEKRRNKERIYRDNNQEYVYTEKTDEEHLSDKLVRLLQKYFPDKRLM